MALWCLQTVESNLNVLQAEYVHLLLQVPVGSDQGMGYAHVACQPSGCLLRIQLAHLQIGLCAQLQVSLPQLIPSHFAT